jgi:hypothetical protein
MLVSLPNLNIVATVDGVVVYTFSSILFDFLYYNRGSNYIIKPYRKYYDGLINRLGI